MIKIKQLFVTFLFFAVALPIFGQNTGRKDQPNRNKLDYNSRDFRFTAGGGYAYRLGEQEKSSDPKGDQFTKDLMPGYNLDLEAQYFFKEKWGLGLHLNYVNSSASAFDLNIPNAGPFSYYSEINHFLLISPSFVYRYDWTNFLLVCNLDIGPLFYTNKAEGAPASIPTITKITGTKTTFAMGLGAALEYKITKKLGAGIKMGYTISSTQSLNIHGQSVKLDKRQSLSNFFISGFISFRNWK